MEERLGQNLRDFIFIRVIRCIDIYVDANHCESKEDIDKENDRLQEKLVNILMAIVKGEDHAKIKSIEVLFRTVASDNRILVHFDDDSNRVFEINNEDSEFFTDNKELIGLTHKEFESYCDDHGIELIWY